MYEKPLPLSSDNPHFPAKQNSGAWLRVAAMCIGVFVVLVGAADVSSRVARFAFGNNAALMTFAPAVVLDTFSVSSTTTAPALVPARLQIASIGVNANVEQVGKKSDGSLGTPKTFGDVAWYALGQKPGEAGTAIFDGHVNNALTTAGVFEHLSEVSVGDTVVVSDQSGRALTYLVTQIQEYAPDASTTEIFSNTGPSKLVLITCDGDWVTLDHGFNKRLLVFAQLQ